MEILPLTTVTDVTSAFVGVVTDNILPVLGLLGTFVGFKFITKWTRKSAKA